MQTGQSAPVAITGLGLVTSLGVGIGDNWSGICAGRSGVTQIDRFATAGLKTTIAATVRDLKADPFAVPQVCNDLAQLVIEEALVQAQIGGRGTFPGPLFLAVTPFELEWPGRLELAAASAADAPTMENLLQQAATGRFRAIDAACHHASLALRLKDKFGTQGSPVSLNTACASGATALQLGVEAIRRGDTQAALCVGADAVGLENLVRFSLLSALSTRNDRPTEASRPFSKDRDGFVMGEGAAAVVLESVAAARARGAKILALLTGLGESVDRFHRTRGDPAGQAIATCMTRAIGDAGLEPGMIDYVNAHGTSTPENDRCEFLALASVMQEHVARIAISSNKSMIGHTVSAAGIIEAAFSVLTLLAQRLPPTINYQTPDPDIAIDVVPNTFRDAKVQRVLSNSFGFGGQNVSLIFEAP
jgi:3-oxoacyl-[acyl-carrier-protein] synthase II